MTYVGGDDATVGCGCPCHSRIEAMANTPELLYFLLALSASKEMPFIPKDFTDWMTYNRKLKREHDEYRKKYPTAQDASKCCEACKMVGEMDAQYEEHQKDPKNECGKPCHICDEHRAAHKKKKNA
jgi:hypothetical protein